VLQVRLLSLNQRTSNRFASTNKSLACDVRQITTGFQNSRTLRTLLTRIHRETLGLDNMLLDASDDAATTVHAVVIDHLSRQT